MTAVLDDLGFDGRPFDALDALTPAALTPAALTPAALTPAALTPAALTPVPMPVEAAPAPSVVRGAAPDGDPAAELVARLQTELLAAHRAAMAVQVRWQEQILADLTGDRPAPVAVPVRAEATSDDRRSVDEGLDAAAGDPVALLGAAVRRLLGDAPATRLSVRWLGAPPRAGEPLRLRGEAVPDVGGTAFHAELYAADRAVLHIEGHTGVLAPAEPQVAAARITYRPEGGLEPLAITSVTALEPAELDLLASGRPGAVFGARHDQQAPPLVRGPLRAVTELAPGGPSGAGVLLGRAQPPADATDVLATGWAAGSVLALWLGLNLCIPDGEFRPDGTATVEMFDPEMFDPAAAEAEVVAEIVAADLTPRPWLRIDVELRSGDRVLARLRGLTVAVHEAPGVPMGTRGGGHPPSRPARRGISGALAVVDELGLARASVGDLTMALGPEFARWTERRACRPPAGGLRLVGRVMEVRGTRGDLSGGSVAITEYDSAADAWYYGAAPSPTVPNVVLMETSLQSALQLGYFLGATLADVDNDYTLRNLDGSATLHRDVDLRGRTIWQRSTLLATTVMTGAVLQGFTYELWLDGEDPEVDPPFYSGQSLFGFFTATALANQAGLDNGTAVPNWLLEQAGATVRTIDVAARRGGPAHASDQLDLLDTVEVVDGGGRHGAGYLRAVRPVAADDWYFARHFHLDPVMPGSLGVEAVVQALQEWLVDTGALDGLAAPEFVVPAGLEMSWRYRGQILAADGALTLEVHIRGVERRPGRVRVVADANLWRGPKDAPGLRIYALDGIAAEVRDRGAQPW